MEAVPHLTLRNHQRRVRLDLAALRRIAARALPQCVAASADGRFALRDLTEVDVAIVSDRRIAAVHWDFMGILGATDVITFEHGEIILSAETALRCASEHGHTLEAELALYIIHGLLHLNGHDDREPTAKKRMFREQSRIWRTALRACCV